MSAGATLASAVDALLARYPFAGLGSPSLVALLDHCEERQLADGEVLCKERSHGNEMFFLVSGTVRITRVDHLGETHHLVTLSAPDLLGGLSLIDNSVRSATVTAEGPLQVRVLQRGTYANLWGAPTPAGSAMRRLLLAALHGQIARAQAQWAGRSGTPALSRMVPPTISRGDPSTAPILVEVEDEELIHGLMKDLSS